MQVYGETHIGKVRETNQDTLSFGTLSERCCFAIVCDGMGGSNGGDVASSIACDIIKEELVKKYSDSMDSYTLSGTIIHSISIANKKIFDASLENESLKGMGTTVVMAVVKDDIFHVAHVGDSRAYVTNHDVITQITNDHSMVQEMVKSGTLTEAEAINHPQKNLITRALGISRDIVVDYSNYSISAGDTFLLCSDGLTGSVSDDEILSIINESKINVAVEKLISAANYSGGKDNITAVLIKNN